MQVQQPRYLGLVADLLPNIRLMQAFGHFIFRYVPGPMFIRKLYSTMHLGLIVFQFAGIVTNMVQNSDEVTELTCNERKLISIKIMMNNQLSPTNV
jgi:odorant receptor